MSTILNLNKNAGILNLTKAAPALKILKGILSWDPSPIHKASLTEGFDLDIFAFVLDANQKITSGNDVVYFNNKFLPSNAVSIPRDNRTGEGDGDDEEILIEYSKMPSDKKFIDIYVFIHEADKRKQTFGLMQNASFELVDADTGKSIQKYNISQYTSETALHVGRVEQTVDGLVFAPYGDVATLDPETVAGTYI